MFGTAFDKIDLHNKKTYHKNITTMSSNGAMLTPPEIVNVNILGLTIGLVEVMP